MSKDVEYTTRPGVGVEPTEDDVLAAARRLKGVVHHTPVMTSRTIDSLCGARLYFKCEHLQRSGSFKLRGAYNAVLGLPAEATAVATHSSGNHAAALALAAAIRDLPAYVVMPEDVPRSRRATAISYGAKVTVCKPGLDARERTLASLAARTGAAVVQPYDSPALIAGHGTAVLELLEEVEGLHMVLVPIGGGALGAGAVLASMANDKGVRILGVEPKIASGAARSLRLGRLLPSSDPDTLADGLRTSLGGLPFSILARNLSSILTADDDAILRAMRLLWERTKQLVEPSAAVTLGAVLENRQRFAGLRVGVILTGGNVDLSRLPWTWPDHTTAD